MIAFAGMFPLSYITVKQVIGPVPSAADAQFEMAMFNCMVLWSIPMLLQNIAPQPAIGHQHFPYLAYPGVLYSLGHVSSFVSDIPLGLCISQPSKVESTVLQIQV